MRKWGEQLAEHEREERYGDGTGPYCIGVKIVIQKMDLIHHSSTVHSQEVLQHLLITNLNLKLMLDMSLMKTERHTPLQLLSLFILEKKYFVIMDLTINCMVFLLVNMIL